MPKEEMFQMAIKAVNDTAGRDGLVPTLLVFGAYPPMTADSPLSSLIDNPESVNNISSNETA